MSGKSKYKYYYEDGTILNSYILGNGRLHREHGLPAVEWDLGKGKFKIRYYHGYRLFDSDEVLKGKLTKEDANLLCLAHFGCEVQWE